MKRLTPVELASISKKIQIKENLFIVLVDTTENSTLQKKIGMQNIFFINIDNEIRWQVSVNENDKSTLKDTFMYLDLNNSEELNADTFFGMEYKINVKTGEAKRTGWHK